jgi:hypothetical protein
MIIKTNNTSLGLSLIELMVAVTLLLIVMSATFVLWSAFGRDLSHSYEEERNLIAANQTLERISIELREMRDGENGAWPLEIAGNQEIAFYADVDDDGQIERVRYWLSGAELWRGIVKPTENPVSYPSEQEQAAIIVSGVRNGSEPIFYYYNQDWPLDQENNPLDPSDRILNSSLIAINLIVSYSDAVEPSAVSSSVALRKLKIN